MNKVHEIYNFPDPFDKLSYNLYHNIVTIPCINDNQLMKIGIYISLLCNNYYNNIPRLFLCDIHFQRNLLTLFLTIYHQINSQQILSLLNLTKHSLYYNYINESNHILFQVLAQYYNYKIIEKLSGAEC